MPRTAITKPRVVSRFMGGSTLFNGSSSYVTSTASSNFRFSATTDDLSVGCYVKVSNGFADGARIISKEGSNDDVRVRMTTGGGVYFTIDPNAGSPMFFDLVSVKKLRNGEWYHIVCTYNHLTGGKIYIDGVLDNSNTTVFTGTTGDAVDVPYVFGAEYTGAVYGNYFKGKIAQGFVVKRELTSTEVSSVHFANTYPSDVALRYALDDLPSTYIDSIAGKNGTGTDTVYSPDTPVQQRVVVSDDKASATGSAISAAGTIDTVTSLAGTVIGMAKVSVYNGNTICCFYASDGVTDAWRFNIESGTGYPFIWTVNTAGSGATNPKPSIPVPKNQWFHFAIVQTISGGVVTGKIYINGQLIGIGTRASDVRSCSRFAIIDNSVAKTMAVAVYERELTPTEIRNHCFGRIIDGIPVGHVIPTGAKINWPRQEGAGNINYDASGNGYDGTGGIPTWSSDTPSKAREAVGGNLVKNGDFSYVPVVNVPTTTSGRWVDGTAGGSTTNKLFGWAVANGSASSFSVNFDSTVGRTSPGSLKLSMLDATGAPNVSINVNVSSGTSKADGIWEVLPNTSYTFNAWVLTDNVGTNDCYCDIREFNSVATAITTTSTNKLSGTSSSWRLLTLTFTTSPTTRFVLPIFRLGQGSDNISSYNIDDISFSKTIPDTRTTV